MSALEKLAHDIAASGVKHVFGIPGSGPSFTLLDALEQRGSVFHLTHIEASAALMAGAIGRLRGKAGVAVGIKGPGLCNMLPGLAACRFEGFPLVSITEAYRPDIPLTKAHKRLDHAALVAGVTKGHRFLSHHGPGFPELARWSEAEVPAPVHLDIAASEIENETPVPFVSDQQPMDSPGLSNSVRRLIASSKCPLVIAGSLALRRGWQSFLNALQIPVFSVASAKGVVDETLPHAAGVYTGVGQEISPEWSLLPKADLVISLGVRHHEVLAAKPFPCPAITVDPVDPFFFSGFDFDEIVAGSDTQIQELFHELATKQWGSELVRRRITTLRETLLSGPFLPAHAYRCLESHVRHAARIVLDTGNFCTIGEHAWRVKRPEWYLSSGQGRYMGIGLPLAIGASLYDQSVPTVAFLGDGGIGMFLADMKLAVHQKLPLLVVLMSDAYLGSVRARALRDQITQQPVTISQPSWQRTLEGLGVGSARVENESQLEAALQAWQPDEGPYYIECQFDPEHYQSMVKGIR